MPYRGPLLSPPPHRLLWQPHAPSATPTQPNPTGPGTSPAAPRTHGFSLTLESRHEPRRLSCAIPTLAVRSAALPSRHDFSEILLPSADATAIIRRSLPPIYTASIRSPAAISHSNSPFAFLKRGCAPIAATEGTWRRLFPFPADPTGASLSLEHSPASPWRRTKRR